MTPTLEEITNAVAKRTGVPQTHIIGRGRDVRICGARHVTLSVAKEFGYNYRDIMGFFGRDATSFKNSVSRTEANPYLSKLADQVANDVWTYNPMEEKNAAV